MRAQLNTPNGIQKGITMSEQNTQVKEPQKEETQAKDSGAEWEKRYKDLQAEYTRRTTHEKELERSMQDLQSNYEQLAGYLTQQASPESTESYEYMTKKDIQQMEARMKQQIEATNLASEFRAKYPDMTQYEDLVSFYLQNKTDRRKTLRERMESAVQSTRDFLEAERQRGIEKAQTEQQKKAEQEALSSGLSYQVTPPESSTPSAETENEYLAWRRKKRGI